MTSPNGRASPSPSPPPSPAAKSPAKPPARARARSAQHSEVERVVQLYGDLLFDLCESVLWSPVQAQNAFRSILKEIKATRPADRFTENERAWILRIAFERLSKLGPQVARKVTSSEQMRLDASPNIASRLKSFEIYFHRLTIEEQVVLLLRDKYGLPYGEISSATEIPEASLKTIRGQALRRLESWLWEEETEK